MSSENEKKPFLGKYLNFMGSTRYFTTPFSWLYVIIALGFLAIPVLILLTGINDIGVFAKTTDYVDGQTVEVLENSKIILPFILTVLASIFAAIVSFTVAWNNKKKNSTDKITIELIIDSVADLLGFVIKTYGHLLAIVGFFVGLFTLIFDQNLLKLFEVIDFGNIGRFFGGEPVVIMIGAVLVGYALVWLSRLVKFLFEKIARIAVKVIVQVFKFVVLYAIPAVYNFIARIGKLLFDYFFIAIQAIVDLFLAVIALVARLGRFLLAYARSPFKNSDYNDAKITYNE